MANFPTSLPNLKTDYEDNVDDIMADNQNDPNDEINKIAEKVGINGVGFNPASSSAPANVALHEDTDNGTHKITFTAPSAIASDKTITLPDETGTVLTTASTIHQYQIVPTVSGNNLTVALKTLSGDDASATNPIYIRIGNTIHTITGALSVTKNAGTNSMNAGSTELATKEIDYFVYLLWNSTEGAISLGFSRIPYAMVWGDFVNSDTSEKFAPWSLAGTYLTSDVCVNIGRFAATLSAGAGYTWTVPTFTATNLVNRPIFETRELTWQPTFSASESMTYTQGGTAIYKYFVIGRRVILRPYCDGITGGTASFQISATMPFSAKTGQVDLLKGSGGGNDGSGTISLSLFTGSDGEENKMHWRRYDSANWGLGVSRVVSGQMEILL